jgi:hypothetical protein
MKNAKTSMSLVEMRNMIARRMGPNPVMHGHNAVRRVIVDVPLCDLMDEPKYQKRFNPAHAMRIAAEFDIKKMCTPTVVFREGKFYQLTGRHATAAIRHINSLYPGYMNTIQCELVFPSGIAEESAIFVARNDHKRLNAVTRHRAKLLAGETKSAAVQNILDQKGVFVNETRSPSPRSTSSIVPMIWAYEEGVLGPSIDVILSNWASEDRAFEVTVFHPIAALIAKNKAHIDLGVLASCLSGHTPEDVTSWGVTGGMERTVRIANCIADAYNGHAGGPGGAMYVESCDIEWMGKA